MPDIYLLGTTEKTDEALGLLQRALVSNDEAPQQVVLTSTDSEDHLSNTLKAEYIHIDDVFQQNDRIVIRPRQGCDIEIRTDPIRHQTERSTVRTTHTAYVEHLGDFVHVVNPYYFYQDRHKVSYRKYCFLVQSPRESE